MLDKRLKGRDYIVGDYSIADIACWPWILFRDHHGIALEDFPKMQRWFMGVQQRPAVQRVLGDFVAPEPPQFSHEQPAMLFGARK